MHYIYLLYKIYLHKPTSSWSLKKKKTDGYSSFALLFRCSKGVDLGNIFRNFL